MGSWPQRTGGAGDDGARRRGRGRPCRAPCAAAGCLCPGARLPRRAGGPAGRPGRRGRGRARAARLRPARAGPGRGGGARPAGRGRLARDRGQRRPEVLRLRHRRRAAGRTGGGFVTGATMANATCLAAARDAVLTRHGWDAAGQGLVGAPPVTVVTGAQAYTTVRKALGLVGLGRDRALVLPADDQGRIDPRDLPRLSGPALVCLQAGNVNSGASDPFPALIAWAREHGAWVHVDGAFGLWAAASPGTAGQVAGIEGADSWATDAHKWLNTTYDCGIALVADPGALRASMEAAAAYLPEGAAAEPMHLTPQSSQRARGAEVWAVLATLGRDGLAALVDRTCALARRFADGVRAAGHTVANDVVLNQVIVDFGGQARTGAVVAAVQEEGTCWCGPTTWRGRAAMRVSVSCWNTTEEDIDRSVAAVLSCAGS